MTIKTRLQITVIISILLALSTGSFIFFVNQNLNEVIEENRRADEIVKGVFELNILTNDYLLRRNERTNDQWWSRYDSISRLLIEAEVSDDPKKQEIVDVLRENHKSIATTFFQLTTVLGRVPDEERSTTSIELEDRLVSQLIARSQTMVASVSTLARENRQELTERQQQLNMFVLAAIFILAATIVASSFLTIRGVLRPLLKLQVGANIIGRGNLKQRIDIKSKDEIGDLGNAFNVMTDKLNESYEFLEDKIKQRTSELETAKNKSEALLASIGDGVLAIDNNKRVVHLNKRGEELSGYKSSEILGKPYRDYLKFVKEDDQKENLDFINSALKGKFSKMEERTQLVRKDGSKLPVGDTATPLKNEAGKLIGAIVVFRDATQERDVEIMREEMVSLTSHQLKNPLSIIKATAQLLEEENLAIKSKEKVEMIERSSNLMIDLVNDLLNISRLEQGRVKFKIQAVGLEKIIDKVLEGLSNLVKERKVKIDLKKPSTPLSKINADPVYMEQALNNIISNAIKYAKDRVSISVAEVEGGIKFVCTDNGLGIPKDEQAKMFKKFFRASNVKKAGINGTGLGMNLTKTIIEKFNGKIRFESEENKGTKFYVDFPKGKMLKKVDVEVEEKKEIEEPKNLMSKNKLNENKITKTKKEVK